MYREVAAIYENTKHYSLYLKHINYDAISYLPIYLTIVYGQYKHREKLPVQDSFANW